MTGSRTHLSVCYDQTHPVPHAGERVGTGQTIRLENLERARDLLFREYSQNLKSGDRSRELKFRVQSRDPKGLHRELPEHSPASLPLIRTG